MSYKCPLCKCRFGTLSDLKLHLKVGTHRGKVKLPTKMEKVLTWKMKRLGKVGKCEYCGKETELFSIRTDMGTKLTRCFRCLELLRQTLKGVDFQWEISRTSM
jgi:DNA-directed RNA polymerase subunit RPC12/RpoP